MATQNVQVAPQGAGASGRGPATEPAPIDVPTSAWYIIEGGVMANQTYTITIKARWAVTVSGRDIEVKIDHFGLSLRVNDTELIIDPRYNSAVLRKNSKPVAVSSKVRYRWILRPDVTVYEAKDFADLVKKSVKELIEETLAKIGI